MRFWIVYMQALLTSPFMSCSTDFLYYASEIQPRYIFTCVPSHGSVNAFFFVSIDFIITIDLSIFSGHRNGVWRLSGCAILSGWPRGNGWRAELLRAQRHVQLLLAQCAEWKCENVDLVEKIHYANSAHAICAIVLPFFGRHFCHGLCIPQNIFDRNGHSKSIHDVHVRRFLQEGILTQETGLMSQSSVGNSFECILLKKINTKILNNMNIHALFICFSSQRHLNNKFLLKEYITTQQQGERRLFSSMTSAYVKFYPAA